MCKLIHFLGLHFYSCSPLSLMLSTDFRTCVIQSNFNINLERCSGPSRYFSPHDNALKNQQRRHRVTSLNRWKEVYPCVLGPPFRMMRSTFECVWTLSALIYCHVIGFIYLPPADWEATVCLTRVRPICCCQKDSHTRSPSLTRTSHGSSMMREADVLIRFPDPITWDCRGAIRTSSYLSWRRKSTISPLLFASPLATLQLKHSSIGLLNTQTALQHSWAGAVPPLHLCAHTAAQPANAAGPPPPPPKACRQHPHRLLSQRCISLSVLCKHSAHVRAHTWPALFCV